MSDYPACSTPNGSTVTVTIPSGWFTHVSGLARNTFTQVIRMRVTDSKRPDGNTEEIVHIPKQGTEANETMILQRTRENSYVIGARHDVQQLEVTSYYSTDPKTEVSDLDSGKGVAHGLTICKAATPDHLLKQFPNYVTFYVFVQASPDQEETEYAPLYNDAVCVINLIKGTGVDHLGLPMKYEGKGGNGGRSKGATSSGAGATGGGATGSGAGATGGGATGVGLSNNSLDIVFVQDCSFSQETYIKTSIDNIVNISTKIAASAKLAPGALRLGLIGFRDIGDQFVTKPFPFTTDISVMKKNLNSLVADGGGDGPEAVAEALDEALLSEWRVDATKLVILITDAPPHGIGEPTDSCPQGSPTGKDPLKIARRMAELGITLHVVACEATLSTCYVYAYDFYKALTKMTGGLVLPLVSASTLADYIIGSSLERVELDALVAKDGKMIAYRALYKNVPHAALTDEYYKKYVAARETVTTLDIEQVYTDSEEARKNVETYGTAETVTTARPLAKVSGHRLLPKFIKGSAAPSVTVSEKPITKEQVARVVKLGINKNSQVLAAGKVVARPASETPTKNSFGINIPTGWFGFVTGLSRAKYNQTIKIKYGGNLEYLVSESYQTDDIMRLERDMGSDFYIFAPSNKSVFLETSYLWSKGEESGADLDDDEGSFTSRKLKVVETQTPGRSLDSFPDYVTYFIMAEDQAEADQLAGVPDYNDCVGIVNLIRNTEMVYKA